MDTRIVDLPALRLVGHARRVPLVHHGVNPKYIDKNHAGVFIIWDKLFGTFQKEEEEPYYGTVKPLTTFNPVWAQLHYWWGLFELSLKARGFDKIKVWFKGPGWKPAYLGGKHPIPEINPATYVKYDAENTTGLRIYAGIVYALSLPVFLVLQQTKGMQLANQVILAVPVVVGLATAGGLMMRKKWGFVLECMRVPLFTLVIYLVVEARKPDYAFAAALFAGIAGAAQLLWLLAEYKKGAVLRIA